MINWDSNIISVLKTSFQRLIGKDPCSSGLKIKHKFTSKHEGVFPLNLRIPTLGQPAFAFSSWHDERGSQASSDISCQVT